MPNHQKKPVFIRVIGTDKNVVGVNPLQISSFAITENVKVKIKPAKEGDPTEHVGNQIEFFYPVGTVLKYIVGLTISEADFNYVCTTLLEFMYLNQPEFEARCKLHESQKMEGWLKQSAENEAAHQPVELPKA